MIEAVVFDLDGVLVDSESIWERVRTAFIDDHGGHWTDDTQRQLMGMNTAEWSAYLHDELGVRLPADEIASGVIGRMSAVYAEHLPLMPGAVEAVRRMARRWPLGLASSSPPVLIDTVLDVAEIRPLFAVTLSTELVPHGKPAPDVYLTAAEHLGVAADRCVAVEDSSNGLRSATAAGLRVIAVPNPSYPPDSDAVEAASAVLGGLDELTEDTIKAIDQT